MSEPEQRPSIKPAENGPLLVKNLTDLANSKGENLETKAVTALCRCGQSANKPYCDGTHNKTGFTSENMADRDRDKREDYAGKQIVIHDNRAICAHVGKCTDGLPGVWRMGQEPWIDPDGADVAAIISIIEQCPSGALSYTLVDDPASAETADECRIEVSKDGPYYVHGPVDLGDAEWGEGSSKTRYALCRCGASKNKPFCDGSHWNIEFHDDKN